MREGAKKQVRKFIVAVFVEWRKVKSELETLKLNDPNNKETEKRFDVLFQWEDKLIGWKENVEQKLLDVTILAEDDFLRNISGTVERFKVEIKQI